MMKKKISLILTCFILGVLVINAVSCNSSKTIEAPLYYEQLSAVIGENMGTVCSKLGISESEIVKTQDKVGMYEIPGEIDYLGYSFEMQLLFTDVSDETLYGFQYELQYSDEPEKAEETVKKLLQRLTDKYGEPDTYQGLSWQIKEQQENLAELFAEGSVFDAYEKWSVSEELELNLRVSSAGDDNKVVQTILLEYRVPKE